MRLARTLITVIGVTLLMTAPVSATDHEDIERCGTDDEPFVCDEIHVILEDGADIEEVVRSHGGDPETDVIRGTAVLNGYLVAVERGTQIDTVADYISDFGNVRSAALLPWRPEYGDLPNTSMPQQRVASFLPALGVGLLVLAAGLSVSIGRRKP